VIYLSNIPGKPMTHFSKTPTRLPRLAVLAAAGLLTLTGCVATGAGGTVHDGPSATPVSPAPATPSASIADGGFYLQAWQTQALAPQNTFGWLPVVTIADGQYIDGRVAIPAIFPGPIYVGLSERPISANGIAAIVTEARADGLLGGVIDFTGITAPGSITAHIRLVVDGVTYDLAGPLPTDASTTVTAPGTVAAFTAFWNRIGTIDTWLRAELGQSQPYSPVRLGVLLAPPADASAGIAPKETPWPLTSPVATFGRPFGGSVYRCAVVTGADLAKLLPVVQASNALTRFVDSAGDMVSIQARVLLPGEASPCG
jgi:hypothetical protein